MPKIIKWLKKGLKWTAIAFGLLIGGVILLVWMADPAKPKAPHRYAQENLYKEESILHFISGQLNLIAPGQLIYIVNREGGRSAFPSEIKEPERKDLTFYLSDKYQWGGPNDDKGGHINGYVQNKLVINNNLCAININPSSIEKTANLHKTDLDKKTFMVITHEAIHCGQSAALHKIKSKFDAAAYKAIAEYDSGHNPKELLKISEIVFMESFVGAYFLANAMHPGQSALLDIISKDGWADELRQSKPRGYGKSFAAIARRCANPALCPANLDELNAQLMSDPSIMRAVVLDAVAIIKASPNFAQAK